MKESQIEGSGKCLLVKTYEWHEKRFTHWFNKKTKTKDKRGVTRID